MSEEEQKAIEIVKKIKNMKLKVTSSFYSSGTISLSIEEREAINTVLNLITKLQKENEEIYENLVSEQEKYKYLYQKALNNTVSADKENLQLKKQINLMADKLVEAHEWFYSEFDNFTKEDFIKYFERKVEEC